MWFILCLCTWTIELVHDLSALVTGPSSPVLSRSGSPVHVQNQIAPRAKPPIWAARFNDSIGIRIGFNWNWIYSCRLSIMNKYMKVYLKSLLTTEGTF